MLNYIKIFGIWVKISCYENFYLFHFIVGLARCNRIIASVFEDVAL